MQETIYRGHVFYLISLTLSFKCLKTAEPQIFFTEKKNAQTQVPWLVEPLRFCATDCFFYRYLTGVPPCKARLEGVRLRLCL